MTSVDVGSAAAISDGVAGDSPSVCIVSAALQPVHSDESPTVIGRPAPVIR